MAGLMSPQDIFSPSVWGLRFEVQAGVSGLGIWSLSVLIPSRFKATVVCAWGMGFTFQCCWCYSGWWSGLSSSWPFGPKVFGSWVQGLRLEALKSLRMLSWQRKV